MLQFINWRVKVTIQDSRYLVGTFIAFDKHMNVILADTEEFRTLRPKGGKGQSKTHKRPLGFVLLRGENVVTMSPETPPAPQPKNINRAAAGGAGSVRPAGRGLSAASLNAGLQGPAPLPPNSGLGGFQMPPPPPPGAIGRGIPPRQ